MRLVLFGPPGAGKGTQARKISAVWRIPHVSTGDMLRTAIASGNELGKQVQATIERGHLVGDELIGRVVEDRLQQPDARSGFLLDGYPRTVRQVEILDQTLDRLNCKLDKVLSLEVPEKVTIERLLGRAQAGDAGQVRSDDNETTIRERIGVYVSQSAPVAATYRKAGLLAEIDGIGTIDEVFGRIAGVLGGGR